MSVFKVNEKSSLSRTMFFDGGVDIARYDTLKYRQFEKLTETIGFLLETRRSRCATRC